MLCNSKGPVPMGSQPWRQTLEILWVGPVMALPVLTVGDAVQVPGSGQQGAVPWWSNICHLILVLLLVSFPNVDNCVWFQLHSTHTYIQVSENENQKCVSATLVRLDKGPELILFPLTNLFEPSYNSVITFILLAHHLEYTRIVPPLCWTTSIQKTFLEPPTTMPPVHCLRLSCHNCAVFKHKPVEQSSSFSSQWTRP